MSPKPRQHPSTPPIRRLLLHTRQLRRHGHLALPILPARQLLPVLVQHDERRQAAGPGRPLDADLARRHALEIGQRLRPEGRVRTRASDDVVRAGEVGGRGGVAGGAEGDGGEAAVTFFGVGLLVDDCEPIYRAAFVRVQAKFGEIVEGLGTLLIVEGAEEGVFSAVQP